MENRIRVGDELLVYSDHHFEKATVIDREKGIYTLNNRVKLNKEGIPINSKMKVKTFDQEEFDYLTAKRDLPKKLHKLEASVRDLPREATTVIFHKVNRLIQKYL